MNTKGEVMEKVFEDFSYEDMNKDLSDMIKDPHLTLIDAEPLDEIDKKLSKIEKVTSRIEIGASSDLLEFDRTSQEKLHSAVEVIDDIESELYKLYYLEGQERQNFLNQIDENLELIDNELRALAV